MVPGAGRVLPQFHRHIGAGSERLDAVSLPEYGDQSVGCTVLASLGWLGYLLSCLDERRGYKHPGGNHLGVYNVYNYISRQFPDLSPADCDV